MGDLRRDHAPQRRAHDVATERLAGRFATICGGLGCHRWLCARVQSQGVVLAQGVACPRKHLRAPAPTLRPDPRRRCEARGPQGRRESSPARIMKDQAALAAGSGTAEIVFNTCEAIW